MAMTSAFLEGIDLVDEERLKSVISLICSEKVPEACHRALLVGHHLHNDGYAVRHIIPGAGPRIPLTLLKWLMRRHRLDDASRQWTPNRPRLPTGGETEPVEGRTQNPSGATLINFRPELSLPPIPMRRPAPPKTGTGGNPARGLILPRQSALLQPPSYIRVAAGPCLQW